MAKLNASKPADRLCQTKFWLVATLQPKIFSSRKAFAAFMKAESTAGRGRVQVFKFQTMGAAQKALQRLGPGKETTSTLTGQDGRRSGSGNGTPASPALGSAEGRATLTRIGMSKIAAPGKASQEIPKAQTISAAENVATAPASGGKVVTAVAKPPVAAKGPPKGQAKRLEAQQRDKEKAEELYKAVLKCASISAESGGGEVRVDARRVAAFSADFLGDIGRAGRVGSSTLLKQAAGRMIVNLEKVLSDAKLREKKRARVNGKAASKKTKKMKKAHKSRTEHHRAQEARGHVGVCKAGYKCRYHGCRAAHPAGRAIDSKGRRRDGGYFRNGSGHHRSSGQPPNKRRRSGY